MSRERQFSLNARVTIHVEAESFGAARAAARRLLVRMRSMESFTFGAGDPSAVVVKAASLIPKVQKKALSLDALEIERLLCALSAMSSPTDDPLQASLTQKLQKLQA
jgi:hypothetical protein